MFNRDRKNTNILESKSFVSRFFLKLCLKISQEFYITENGKTICMKYNGEDPQHVHNEMRRQEVNYKLYADIL